MFLSAANVLALSLAWWGPQQLSTPESVAWKRFENSIAMVMDGTTSKGGAALIDDQGLFVAHRSAVAMQNVTARFSSGETIQLTLISTDDPTQLALLRADPWIRGRHPVLKVAEAPPSRDMRKTAFGGPVAAAVQKVDSVLAVLPTGVPIRAELAAFDKIGIVNPARRVMTLSEFRFEAPTQNVGGSLMLSLDGKLLGILGATLGSQEMMDSDARGGGGGGAAQRGVAGFQSAKSVGPAALTVGYSIGPDILQRVVDGFRTPSHQVEHPALGILCKDSGSGGALVETVLAGSPAEAGGLKANDVIIELAGQPIGNQIDYARYMLKQKVGSTITAKIQRGGQEMTLSLKVGK